ncbi:MAG: winged helix-turn-helix domain-containing protein [Gammaproteobacteria bacterium]
MEKPVNTVFYIEQWRISPGEGLISRDGEIVHLEPRAMEVLVYMTSRPNEVISREELEKEIWHGAIVGYDAVTNTIIKLRRALNDNARQPRIITTIPKKGYQLIAPVAFVAKPAAEQEIEKPEKEQLEKTRSKLITPANIGILAIVLVFGTLWLSSENIPSIETSEPASFPSIAILPFDNLSNDPKQEYLADGMTEDIITDLSGLSNLMVIASNTSSIYRDKNLPSKQIGDELGVKYILKGSVRPLGNTIRINTQLINAETGFNVWAKRYDRNLNEVFAVQDEVTQNIVSSLTVKVSSQEKVRLAQRETDSLKAYDFFQEGQRLSILRTKEGYQQAHDAFEKAIELDPAYGRAYGAIAVILNFEYLRGWVDAPVETLDRALVLSRKAVELSNSVPQTHWALGFTHLMRKEYEQAEQAVTHAINISPNYSEGFGLLALVKMNRGKADEAIKLNNKGKRLNPYYSWQYLYTEGCAYFSKGDYASAISALEKASARNESAIQVKLFLAASYAYTNRQRDAEWITEEIKALSPTATVSDVGRNIPIEDPEFKKSLLLPTKIHTFQ